jgi:lantibiotic biosynthesis protein
VASTRPSWCYGTPGLARAQQLAGLALGDPGRYRLAEQALAGCLADERQLAQLSDASLCHGLAGVLQTTWRVAADAQDPEPFAMARLLTSLERHRVRHGPPSDDGLLEGITGVQLARHTIAAGAPPASGWDACLLLDGARI